jgi:hypothetical protein
MIIFSRHFLVFAIAQKTGQVKEKLCGFRSAAMTLV